MKLFILIAATLLASSGAGYWINQNLDIHYFIEEYYFVQNLDPANEKDTELIRQKIQSILRRDIPAKTRPDDDKFQCFKILSEAVFFCSLDTYRKGVAFQIKKLLQETIPQEIGWFPEDEAMERLDSFRAEFESSKVLISDLNRQLEKVKKQSSKQQAEEKKFTKTNDLYKKTISLLEKKIEVLQSLVSGNVTPDQRTNYRYSLEEAQANLALIQEQMNDFHQKNQNFAENAQQHATLEKEIQQMKEKSSSDELDLAKMEMAIQEPNAVGMIADAKEIQLISDESRRKFHPVQKPANAIWFSLVIFFLVTNFILRLRPSTMVSLKEDGTMTEARL
jgi:hypothetical protein